VSTRGGLTDAGGKKLCAVTTNCEKSAEAIVPGNPGRAEQSQVPSKPWKEDGAMKAEYSRNAGCPQRASAEHEEYEACKGVCGTGLYNSSVGRPIEIF